MIMNRSIQDIKRSIERTHRQEDNRLFPQQVCVALSLFRTLQQRDLRPSHRQHRWTSEPSNNDQHPVVTFHYWSFLYQMHFFQGNPRQSSPAAPAHQVPPPEPDKLMTYEQAMIYAHPALKDACKRNVPLVFFFSHSIGFLFSTFGSSTQNVVEE